MVGRAPVTSSLPPPERGPFPFSPITEQAARTILAWRYDGPYATYNCAPADVEASIRLWLDPANGYYAARRAAGELVGYGCFGPDARGPGGDYSDQTTLDVGLGLRPDLTGQGLGPHFVAATLDFAQARLQPCHLRLTVAAWNHRAIRVYEKAGFRVANSFVTRRDQGETE